jgi:hypothetical protein
MVDSVQYNNRLNDGTGHSCFGFMVDSSCPFRFLRPSRGEETLEIIETSEPLAASEGTLLYEWTLRDLSGDVSAKLYGRDHVFHFWTGDAGWYQIDPAARRIKISPHEDEVRREQRLWGIPTTLCFMQRGDFALHAAAVEVDDKAILLAAPGRFGKTTLALAFHRRGYRLLTEDTACCGLAPEAVLLPGPTSVRLRPDMFDGEAPPGTTVVAVRKDRIHLALDSYRVGDGRPVPIKALVFLRESSGDIFLERLKSSTAIPDLWTLNFRLQNEAARGRSFSQLAQLATTVPVWDLHRPLQAANLDEIVSRIVEAC